MPSEFAQIFIDMLSEQGAEASITRDSGSGQKINIPVRTLKNQEEKGAKRVYFGFMPLSDVRIGDIIRLVNSRDEWLVTDTEDQIVTNHPVQLKAIVEKYKPGMLHTPKSDPMPTSIAGLHKEVQKIAGPLIASGHLRQAITDVFIGLDNYVELKSGITDNGASLMQKAFSATKPILELSTDMQEQTGFMMLFSGAMKAIRNRYAHSLVDPKTSEEALEWLGFASALYRLCDSATKKTLTP